MIIWRSTRLEINSGNIDRHEYGPFGEINVDGPPIGGYIGEQFDPHTGAYDFIARPYDPIWGRFLGRDPRSASSEPCAYAGNNPINYLDPDGRQPVHFFLYSAYGTIVPDDTGTSSMYEDTSLLIESMRNSPVPIAAAPLEFDHQRVFAGGCRDWTHDRADPWRPRQGQHRGWRARECGSWGGHEFAEYLHSRIRYLFGVNEDRGPTSINFLSCANSRRTRSLLGGPNYSEDSFADVFARSAPDYFPSAPARDR